MAVPRVGQERSQLRAFVRNGLTLRVVLVIGGHVAGRGDDSGEVALELGEARFRGRTRGN